MVRTLRCYVLILTVGIAAGYSAPAWAVPYASGIHDVGGGMREFVLNEGATAVKVLRDGGNPVNFVSPAAGRYQFDMTGFSTYSIEVSKNAPTAWTVISDATSKFQHFEQPSGIAVNNMPSSPYFGTIYVGNSRNLPSAGTNGRAQGEGIYALTSDRVGYDIANNYAVIADPADVTTTQVKRPASWVIDASTTATSGRRSPWRITLDAGGNLIVADWGADVAVNSGGLKWASADLSTGGELFAATGVQDPTDGAPFGMKNSGGNYYHSAITSRPHVTGTLGVDLTVTAIDQYLEAVPLSAPTDGQNIWKWNFGTAQSGFETVPQLITNGTSLGGDGTWFVGIQGVTADMMYSPQHDLYYLSQPRADGLQPSVLIVDANLAADPTGNTPIIKFNSLAFTQSKGLDGCVGSQVNCGATTYQTTGGQDIFRLLGNMELSPDGTKLFARRASVIATSGTGVDSNPVLGRTSNNSGTVLVIPLDADGLPIITIDEMGTPGDTSDDRITNFGNLPGAFGGNPGAYSLAQDIAGNFYTTNSNTELLEVFSPGGNWKAVTGSGGTFATQAITGLLGDYNGDGSIDAADYVLWRDNVGTTNVLANDPFGGTIGTLQYDLWKANFGKTFASGSGSGASLAAVPEPGALLLALLGIVAASAIRKRR